MEQIKCLFRIFPNNILVFLFFYITYIKGSLICKNLSEYSASLFAMFYKSLDLFAFRDDSRDWNSEIFDLYSKIKESEIRSIEKRDSSRILKANLFLQLDDYTGKYNHDLAGEVIIRVSGNQLNININNFLSLVGTHWHYNTFITSKNGTRMTQILQIITDKRIKSGLTGFKLVQHFASTYLWNFR